MEYQNPILIAQYQERINELGQEIAMLNVKKDMIKKTNILPSREELESLGLLPAKQKSLTMENKIS